MAEASICILNMEVKRIKVGTPWSILTRAAAAYKLDRCDVFSKRKEYFGDRPWLPSSHTQSIDSPLLDPFCAKPFCSFQ